MNPKCTECGEELTNWEGNVMVPRDEFTKRRVISQVIVICKECTRKMDATGYGLEWHGIWELVWVKKRTLYVLGRVLHGVVGDRINGWSREAAAKVYELSSMAHPELADYSTVLP